MLDIVIESHYRKFHHFEYEQLFYLILSSVLLEEFGIGVYLASLLLFVFTFIGKLSKIFVFMAIIPVPLTFLLYLPIVLGAF